MRALGVLLAGGRGSRLGGDVPKALRMCAGRTLLERALGALRAACEEVVVVAPEGMSLPVPARERVADPPMSIGPLPAMIAGLGARAHDEALVLAVDMPLAHPTALARLRACRGDALAVVPRPGGLAQPLAAWYSKHARERLARELEAGVKMVTVAVERLSPAWVEDEELATWPGGREAWTNVNTREDLAMAESRLLAERR